MEILLFLHTLGIFETDPEINNIKIPLHKTVNMNVEHEVFKILEFEGQPCNNNEEYSKDICMHRNLENRAIDKYGCTTPYGPNKDRICKNKNNGIKVLEMFHETMNNIICKHSCSFTTSKAIIKDQFENNFPNTSSVTLNFRHTIKVTEDKYIYDGTLLIMEVCGYLGLFLSVFINQLIVLKDNF